MVPFLAGERFILKGRRSLFAPGRPLLFNNPRITGITHVRDTSLRSTPVRYTREVHLSGTLPWCTGRHIYRSIPTMVYRRHIGRCIPSYASRVLRVVDERSRLPGSGYFINF